jgi:hypothetical protein
LAAAAKAGLALGDAITMLDGKTAIDTVIWQIASASSNGLKAV